MPMAQAAMIESRRRCFGLLCWRWPVTGLLVAPLIDASGCVAKLQSALAASAAALSPIAAAAATAKAAVALSPTAAALPPTA